MFWFTGKANFKDIENLFFNLSEVEKEMSREEKYLLAKNLLAVNSVFTLLLVIKVFKGINCW